MGFCVTLRKGGDSPVKFFAKVLADGTVGLLVTLWLSAVRQVKFLPSFFSKKRVFGYFFQKVTLLIKTSLFCS